MISAMLTKMESVAIACPICLEVRNRYFANKSGWNIRLCEHCGFAFVHPIPTQQELKQLYSRAYFRNEGKTDRGYTDYDKDKEPMRSIFELYLSKLERLSEKKHIFDVGAATGYFLDIARSRGWKTYGSEISEYGASEASRRGHQIIYGSIVDKRPPEKMGAVTMWDVLEHVSDPLAYLRAANAMLEPEGILAINTVDRGSWWARFMGSRWHLMIPPEHLSYFTRESLEIALEACGFEPIEYRKIGKSFSPSYVFKTLGSWQGIEIWNILARMADSPFFRVFSLPINLRDNVFVLAKKRNDLQGH